MELQELEWIDINSSADSCRPWAVFFRGAEGMAAACVPRLLVWTGTAMACAAYFWEAEGRGAVRAVCFLTGVVRSIRLSTGICCLLRKARIGSGFANGKRIFPSWRGSARSKEHFHTLHRQCWDNGPTKQKLLPIIGGNP